MPQHVDDNPLRSPIVLVLPAETELIRLARLMASGVATTVGLPLDEVEDLRVAVDEVCATLIEASTEGPINLSFTVTDNRLVVSGHATSGAPLDTARVAISRQILDAITDEQQISNDDQTIRFRISRRLPATDRR
jgi:serine/threonine-protein kinase RsbW